MMSYRCAVAWAAAFVYLIAAAGTAGAAGVVFRYLPGSPDLSSSIDTREVEPGPFLAMGERVARGPGGWGYDPGWAGEFNAPGSALREMATDDASQPFGPNITAEIWVRPLDLGGRQALVTNRIAAGEGLTLGLEDGVPFFEIVVSGETYRVDAASAVAEGEDVWLAATAAYAASGSLELTIYRNGSVDGSATISTTIPSPYSIRHPFFVATEAAGTDDAPVLTGTMTGLVYAALVRDYLAHSDYLNTPPPFDGSTYFGLPDFHDYELGTFHLPMDQRIDSWPTPIAKKVYLPHVNDEFIPQGTAVISDAETGEAELLYVSYYHRTRNNRLREHLSIVAEIDVATGAVRRTFRLTGRLDDSHAGGIAIAGGAVFVSSASYIERYPIPEFDPEAPRYLDLIADDAGSAVVQSKASFVSEYADTLWIGDYRTNSEQPPYLYGYPLDGDGRLVSGGDPVIYPIPRYIQGVDLHTEGGVTYVLMSRNRNGSEGEVLRFIRSDLDPYTVPQERESITFPHGIEDLAFAEDGTLWTNSESGTDFYQRNAEWSSFFPFAYGVEREAVVPTGMGSDMPSPSTGGFSIDAFPNPVAERLVVSLALTKPAHVRVRVIDSLGRQVATLVDTPKASGTHVASWTSRHAAQGVYLIVAEAGEHRQFRLITVAR